MLLESLMALRALHKSAISKYVNVLWEMPIHFPLSLWILSVVLAPALISGCMPTFKGLVLRSTNVGEHMSLVLLSLGYFTWGNSF